jgi:hypothetical protein
LPWAACRHMSREPSPRGQSEASVRQSHPVVSPVDPRRFPVCVRKERAPKALQPGSRSGSCRPPRSPGPAKLRRSLGLAAKAHRPSDAALASRGSCALDLGRDEVIDSTYVKSLQAASDKAADMGSDV